MFESKMYAVVVVILAAVLSIKESDSAKDKGEIIPLDLVFLVDNSESISEAEIKQVTKFLSKLVDRLPVREDLIRIGVLTFFNIPEIKLFLNSTFSKKKINQQIESIETGPSIIRKTNLIPGLRQLISTIFKPENGDRSKVSNVVVVITDGRLNDLNESIAEVKKLRRSGVSIIPVGVTTTKSDRSIIDLASEPKELDQDYFLSKTFEGLDERLANALIQRVKGGLSEDEDSINILQSHNFTKDEITELRKEVPRLKALMAEVEGLEIPPAQAISVVFDDMVLRPSQVQTMIKIYEQILGRGEPSRKKRKVINFSGYPSTRRWNVPIDYTLISYDTPADTGPIKDAIAEWSSLTCLTFREITPDKAAEQKDPVIIIQNEPRCLSEVGQLKDRREQYISLGVKTCIPLFGKAVHEIGHALGFWHEQNRPDSKKYIKFHKEHFRNDLKVDVLNFVPFKQELVNTHNIPYDYSSVMQYGTLAFGTPNSDDTVVETLQADYQQTIGQRTGLSFLDVKAINAEYCENTCSEELACKQGGITNPSACKRCVCPDGFGGKLCDIPGPNDNGCSPNTNQVIMVTSSEQSITSPNYGRGPYKLNTQCNWILKAPKGRKIRLYFKKQDKFKLFCYDKACMHWIELKFGEKFDVPGPRFCCNLPQQAEFISRTEEAVITFRSRVQIPNITTDDLTGFKLYFTLAGTDKTTKSPGETTPKLTETTNLCIPNPCKNKGRCKEGKCKCRKPYTGDTCEERIDTVSEACEKGLVPNTKKVCIATCQVQKPPRKCPNPPKCVCPRNRFLEGKRCVPKKKCRCRDIRGKARKEGDTWLTSKCDRLFSCGKFGRVTSSSHNCGAGEKCKNGMCVGSTPTITTGKQPKARPPVKCQSRKKALVLDHKHRQLKFGTVTLNPQEEAADVLEGSGAFVSFVNTFMIAIQTFTAKRFTVMDVQFTVIGADYATVLLSVNGSSQVEKRNIKVPFDDFTTVVWTRGVDPIPANGLRDVMFIDIRFFPSEHNTTVKALDLYVRVCPQLQ